MKPIINNPASTDNMWVSKMPYNFQAAKKVTSGVVFTSSCTHHNQVDRTIKPPSRPTKTMLVNFYIDQIHPQYPFLTKAKIRAALALADNNLHECRLILDLKTKLIEVKKSFNNVPAYSSVERLAKHVDSPYSTSNTAARTKPIEIDKKTNVERFSSKVSSTSTVYDFSDTDSDIETPSEWLSQRRTTKLAVPGKIGVVIMKCDTGYKASPLK